MTTKDDIIVLNFCFTTERDYCETNGSMSYKTALVNR